MESLKESHSPPTGSEEGLDPTVPEIQEPDPSVATKRILRRTPRSWSLREVASEHFEQTSISQASSTASTENLAENSTTDEAVHSKVEPTEDESTDALPANSWKRQVYPLRSTMSNGSTQESKDVPSQSEIGLTNGAASNYIKENREASQEGAAWDGQMWPMKQFISEQARLSPSGKVLGSEIDHATNTLALQVVKNVQASEEGTSFQRQAYPLQVPVASLLSPPSSEAGPESTNKTSTPQLSGHAHSAEHNKLLKRPAYPLQTAASITSLRLSPTPPASPDREHADATRAVASETQEAKKVLRKVRTLRRDAYPLQSPASVLNLKEQAQSQPSVTEDDPTPDAGLASTSLQPFKTRNEAKPQRRQGYPLQSPASLMNLKDATAQEASAAEVSAGQLHDQPLDDVRKHTQTSNTTGSFRRQIYPLQSAASMANLKRSSTPPPPAEEYRSKDTYGEPVINHAEGKRTTDGSTPVPRQFYPLQTSASIPCLRLPPSPSPSPPPSAETEPQDKNQLYAPSSRDREIASKVIKHWRRQVYPLQSFDNVSLFNRPPTPQPSEPEAKGEHDVEPIQLPKNIRAVKDAEAHESKGRTIIVCLDGTGDKFDNDNSNIVHLISALKKDDPCQVSYYQAGIGTYSKGGLSSGVSAALDMAVGSELGLHVRDAYQFLMHSYKEGDKICIFGFSRGAYTARCLAGMVHKVGLLPPRNIEQIAFAYEFYANDTPEGWDQSEDFKATFCIDVSVHFIGCFDSVASVGLIPRQLPLSSTPNNKARYFRHAMALDERRAKFKVCRHQHKALDDTQQAETAFGISTNQNDAPPWASRARYGEDYHPNVTDEEFERLAEAEETFDTDVLEVWFAGAHADVGGGAVANVERHKLAQIPLRWMIRQAFECNTGIIFKTKKLAEFGLDVHTLWPKYRKLNVPVHGPPPSFLEKYDKCLPPKSIRRSKLVSIDKVENGEQFYHLKSQNDEDWTSEQVEDFYDAMSSLNDQLVQAPRWWILEVWPVQYKVPIAPGEVQFRTGMNLGRYRGVDDFEPNIHWTVLHREQHIPYRIQARTAAHTKWRVVT
ncbi:uncharacterized protein A1O9_04344 [Exophiala aquamarina CBS 119918]|uniref:T6SS Phospholipase effector Tle1-like catalytic domain-containing protein n=1 Tax=Exophiala aquamarina CBS 119918 TaxID=1182545 RepID=A0A072PVA1_9EURO|nr:uncharacterized protein A1O9_04344 [Exophiala aquamarina CBS 119918]KEF59500.1 hypothetical protein A1O9_04344 [Exophiala aquamarina CBS 119918]